MRIGELNQSVAINGGFPGTYVWKNGTSYYLNGDTSTGEIHFSVNGRNDEEFTRFHVTRSINGTNIGIWYTGTKRTNIVKDSLPSSKEGEWTGWWAENQGNCDAAAAEFWTAVQT